jgi:hypothetical protein
VALTASAELSAIAAELGRPLSPRARGDGARCRRQHPTGHAPWPIVTYGYAISCSALLRFAPLWHLLLHGVVWNGVSGKEAVTSRK